MEEPQYVLFGHQKPQRSREYQSSRMISQQRRRMRKPWHSRFFPKFAIIHLDVVSKKLNVSGFFKRCCIFSPILLVSLESSEAWCLTFWPHDWTTPTLGHSQHIRITWRQKGKCGIGGFVLWTSHETHRFPTQKSPNFLNLKLARLETYDVKLRKIFLQIMQHPGNATRQILWVALLPSNSDHKHQHHHLFCRWYLFPFNHCLVRRGDNPTNTVVSTQGRRELVQAHLVTYKWHFFSWICLFDAWKKKQESPKWWWNMVVYPGTIL